jgi:hypothetical protein
MFNESTVYDIGAKEILLQSRAFSVYRKDNGYLVAVQAFSGIYILELGCIDIAMNWALQMFDNILA